MNPEIPNETQNQTQSQPVVQSIPQSNPVPTQTPPPSRSVKKYIIGIIILVVLIIIGLGTYFLLHKPDHYQFTINGTAIPENDFKDVFSYYKNESKTTFSPTATFTFIKNTYSENYILKNEYIHEGKSLSNLNTLSTLPSDMPASFKEILAQNSALKSEVLSKIGIKTRTGSLFLMTAVASGSADQKQLDQLMVQRLNFYKDLLKTSTPTASIKKTFTHDTQVLSQPKIKTYVTGMKDMSTYHPFYPGNDFLNKVFSTSVGHTSDIFKVVDGNYMTYGIAYITQASNGTYENYIDWLNEHQQALNIKTNFSDFQ